MPDFDSGAVRVLSQWYDAQSRDLPWRTPDTTPWGVLVSEVMLQQTPVNRVEPVWLDWMARWPKPSALAVESRGTVVRAWGKLGYPRRALRLHEAAGAIADRHGDVVPHTVDDLEALPGVGTYTARAVACFGYGQRVPVVDTNVRRVMARVVDGAADAGSPSAKRDLAAVDMLLPRKAADAAKASIALMELGALICTARSPHCGRCPISRYCKWFGSGRPAGIGAARPAQRFAGTDRQVRGLLLDVLRGSDEPVRRPALDLVWPDAAQRDRCLDSLLVDGLVAQGDDGRFGLPGEHAGS